MRSNDPAGTSYAWLFSYSTDISERFAASFTWQNEGHIPDHHRDGHSVQLWAQTRLFSPQFKLGGTYEFEPARQGRCYICI
jgi:hypothetical protein